MKNAIGCSLTIQNPDCFEQEVVLVRAAIAVVVSFFSIHLRDGGTTP
jgi:hypothetical protein